MKEAMGGISIFQIVIVFILLFTGIMCLTINHAKAFGVKDEIINILEELDDKTLDVDLGSINDLKNKNIIDEIVEYLNESNYRAHGECPTGGYIGYNRNGSETSGNDATFCIRINDVTEAYNQDLRQKCASSGCSVIPGGFPQIIYYDIALFYQLDIPIITNLQLKVYGSTKMIYR